MRRLLLLSVLFAVAGCDVFGGDDVVRQDASAFPVRVDGQWGFIDAEGRLQGPPRFDFADEVVNDRAAIRQGALWGYARPDGSVAVEPQYVAAGRFEGRLAPVRTATEGWAYVDRDGARVGNGGYDSAEPFSDGRAAVRSGFLWGYIDESGAVVIEPQFAAAGPFVEGLAPVQTADGWQYVDRSGAVVVGETFAEAGPFSAAGLAPVREAGSEVWKYVDRSGRIALNTTFEAAAPFSEGYAAVRVGDRTGFIGTDGTFLVGPKMAEAGRFSEGRAAVRFNNRWTYVSRDDGLIITSPEFASAAPFRGGLGQVTIGNGENYRVGYVDADGAVVWEPQR